MTDNIIVCSTCPNTDVGNKIAATLVKESLAACVNIVPGIQSVYQWQGEIHTDNECLLLIKTRADLYKDLETRVVELHPYELPEVVAVSMVQGLETYLDWISKTTRLKNENKN